MAVGLLLTPALVAQAAGHGQWPRGIVPPRRPAANVPAQPPFLAVCAAAASGTPACAAAAIAALDHARRVEGLGPLTVPSDFARLTSAEQLFVLVDEERTSRGLAPYLGLSAGLDAVAATAARRATDPIPAGSRLGGDTVVAWGGNWGAGPGPLGVSYGWMYEDGFGAGNLACSTPAAPGCWGHRDNILVRWAPTPGRWLVMGAASVAAATGLASAAESFALVQGPRPSVVYTWSEARSAGF
ncbi:MAG TPA: hypothetical protein VMW47_08155 [Verrucomicrobiae bacterium]|nr:hypothetical protein [Verrucomicrobiae bacterium]